MRAFSAPDIRPALTACVERALALAARPRVSTGYDRPGPANDAAGNPLRRAAVSLAIGSP